MELDVRMTRDGIVVVIHDETLLRIYAAPDRCRAAAAREAAAS